MLTICLNFIELIWAIIQSVYLVTYSEPVPDCSNTQTTLTQLMACDCFFNIITPLTTIIYGLILYKKQINIPNFFSRLLKVQIVQCGFCLGSIILYFDIIHNSCFEHWIMYKPELLILGTIRFVISWSLIFGSLLFIILEHKYKFYCMRDRVSEIPMTAYSQRC